MPLTIDTICGEFNFHRAQKLRRRTATAVAQNADEFKFQGTMWQTEFAQYMVELLETQFPLSSEDFTDVADDSEREEVPGTLGTTSRV